MWTRALTVAVTLSLTLVIAQQKTPTLKTPIIVKAAGSPIIANVGHAAPLLYDYNKDGRMDLIVGEFGGGRARVYLNKAKKGLPRFEGFTFIEANGVHASVPSS
jgi:hypothetical protein